MERPIRVAVADDHPVYRAGVRSALDGHPGLEVVGEAANGQEALALITETAPDVALIDLRMPVLDGRRVLRALKRAGVETKVVFLSAFIDPPLVHQALASGAAGYLSKDAEGEELCQAVTAAAGGETVVSPALQTPLLDQIGQPSSPGASLSERELAVLALAAGGRTISDIGATLYLGEPTVKTYLRRAYEKLGATNKAEAVAEAMRRGILE